MNKKIGLLSILFLGAILIATIIYYVFYFSTTTSSKTAEPKNIIPVSDTSLAPKKIEKETIEIKKPTIVKRDLPLGQSSLERMARSFTERFGSFSNQSNFTNITDLKMVMSSDMQNWANSYIEKNKKSNVASDVYYGLTTKALSTNVKNFDDERGEATILVETRRRETIGSTSNASKLFNQTILVTFVKENRAWRVDSAYWQE